MYDVVEQTNEEGNFVIRCIQDEKETALLNAFLKTTKNSRQNAVVQVLLTPFLLPRIEVLQPAERPLSFNFPSLSFYLKTPDISVAIPPPEKV